MAIDPDYRNGWQQAGPSLDPHHQHNGPFDTLKRADSWSPSLDEGEIARHLHLLDPDADSFIFASFDDDKERAKETARIRKGVDDGKAPRSALADRILPEHRHGTVEQHLAWMERRQGQGAGIFVTVQTMKGARRLKEEVSAIRAVFGELDHGMPETWPLEPSFITESSLGRYHPYWLVDPEHPLRQLDFTGIMMCLIETYGSDPDAKDMARVLRLAGTWNLKAGRPAHLVKVIGEGGYRYASTELLAVSRPAPRIISTACHTGPRPKFNSRMAPGLERFIEPMKAISPEKYSEWIRVGQALHCESDGSAEGLRMWDAWSASSTNKWHPGICDEKWKSFNGQGITGGTIFEIARRYGYRRPDCPHVDINGPVKRMRANGTMYKDDVVGGGTDGPPSGPELEIIFRLAKDITPENVTWVWPGRIPRGKLSLLGGHPEEGKTLLALKVAATVSTGGRWPDGSQAEQGNVIILSAEDDAAAPSYHV